MFCPECGAEYRQGFYECAYCQVALVPELPPEQQLQPDVRLVPVLEAQGPVMFAMAKSILDEAGIECFGTDGGLSSLLGAGRMGAGVYVQVREEDAQEAKELLKDLG